MKIIVVIVGILFSNAAFANLTGIWQGAGRYYKGNSVVECENVVVVVAQQADSLQLSNAFIQCGSGMKRYPDMKLDIADSQLFYGSENVGRVSNWSVNAQFESDGEVHMVDFVLTGAGGLQVTQQVWGQDGEMYIFEAVLGPITPSPLHLGLNAERVHCESAWNELDLYFYLPGEAHLVWTNKVSPHVDPISRNAVRERHSRTQERLRFEDGEVLVSAALLREQVLSAGAQARFTNGRVENYTCIRR